ncbi:MAG: RNase adapter RapZ [Rhodospirillales bacterium]
MASSSARSLVLVTGLSGAGRATALKALEDLGYEAVDNLPLSLLPDLARPSAAAQGKPLALGLDVRTRGFAIAPFLAELERLRARSDLRPQLLFLDCDNDVLLRRYTETRRRHPLAADRPVIDGIVEERCVLAPWREAADLTLDTSLLNAADLKRVLGGHFTVASSAGLNVFVVSFSYRRGLPREADLVFDCRFLANPHYVPALQPRDGRDKAVHDYIAADPAYAGFINGIKALISPLLPRFEKEGKSYLTVAVGCTGGRHRSVLVAEELAMWLGQHNARVSLAHRDLGMASDAGERS